MNEYQKLKKQLTEEKLRGEAPEFIHQTGYQILRAKGYIDEDETPTGRLTFIAEYLSEYIPEEIREKAKQKFKHLLLSGKYSLSTPAYSNIGKPYRGMSISCFVAGTKVNTDNGMVNIEELGVGNKVLTHTGTYRPVTATMNRESDDLYELSIGKEDFVVTGNHLVLTKEDGWVRVDELDPNQHNIVQIMNTMNFTIKKLKTDKKVTVYDITVDVDHSFAVGKNKTVVHNCSGSSVSDSVDSFYKNNHEIAMLSKNGFGTSAYLGDIRPRGSKITGGGKTEGIVPVMDTYFDTASKISQGGSRRGAVACYFPIDHPDAKEVFHYVEKNPKGSNIGVNISDSFIERYKNKEPEAIELFQELCFSRCIGKGYIHFVDRANRALPDCFKRKGMTIKGSNLCLTGDTKIMIFGEVSGMVNIDLKSFDTLYKETDDTEEWQVWSFNIETELSGWKRVEASAMSNPSAKIVKITDEETGKFIKCTPEHKVYTKNRGYVESQHLTEEDVLVISHRSKGISLENKGIKLEYLEEEQEVFDLTVEGNHNFFANNILVHNCSEIDLPSDDEYSFTCCLSSLNLSQWNNITEEDIMYSLLMLDCINSDFIKHCPPELKKVKKFAEDFRAIGLGVMGLATYFQNEGIVFDSLDAKFKNQEIFRKISLVGKEANLWMGDLLGVPEALKEEGHRNATQFAVAPTLSTAVIMGGVSQGIEPIFANTYIHESSAGDIRRASPWVSSLLKSKGKWNKDIIDTIVENEGSISHLDFLTDEEKALGKTAYEQDQYAIIRMAEDRAQYIDQGQSVNLYFNGLATEQEIGDVHRYAFNQCKNLKALYYIRSMSMENSKIKHEVACESCAG